MVEDIEDLILPGVHACPSQSLCLCVVPFGQGVGNVVGRQLSVEMRCPTVGSCHPPNSGHHAVDCATAAVPLGQGAFASGVVDVRRPPSRQSVGEGRDGQDLGQNLQGVDKSLALGQHVEKPRQRLAEVTEGVVADAHHVAPPVLSPPLPLPAGGVGHMARLDASAVLEDEGVREDGGLDLPRRAIGMASCLIPQFSVSLAAVSISSALCSWSSVREPCSATRVANRSAKSSMPSCGSGPGSVGIAVGGCVCSSCTDRYSEVAEEASVLGSRTGGVVGAKLMPPASLPPPTRS